jgi:hypothetical protein
VVAMQPMPDDEDGSWREEDEEIGTSDGVPVD